MASDVMDLNEDAGSEILPGLQQTTAYDGRVMAYRLNTVKEETLHEWATHICDTLATWPIGKPYFALHDLSNAGVSLQYATLVDFNFQNIAITAEGRQRAESIIKHRPDLKAYVAVCFNLTVSGKIGKLFSMRDLEELHPRIQYKSFYTRTKGFIWLVDCMTG